MIVLDASAALELLLNTEAGQLVAERIEDKLESIHVPHLLTAEVAQVLRRYVHTGTLDSTRAQLALEDLADLDATRYGHEELLTRAWELRSNLTIYDALYVALTEALSATLLTFDRKLAAAPGNIARIETLA